MSKHAKLMMVLAILGISSFAQALVIDFDEGFEGVSEVSPYAWEDAAQAGNWMDANPSITPQASGSYATVFEDLYYLENVTNASYGSAPGAYSGDNYLRLARGYIGGSEYQSRYTVWPPSVLFAEDGACHFEMMVSATDIHDAGWGIAPVYMKNSSGAEMTAIGLSDTGEVQYLNSGVWTSIAGASWTEGNWYKVEIDYTAYNATATVTFDGIEATAAVSPSGDIASFQINPFRMAMYVDDVNMSIPTELLPGDANRDGVVSAGDYASVQSNFGNTGDPGIPGDANGDGVVSAEDYASVKTNFGSSATTGVIPEPATLSVICLAALGFIRRRRL